MGYKELAQYLLDQGAQANIFTAALFGKIEIVKPMLEAFPLTLHAKGPHGFTLLHHAEKGGEEAMPGGSDSNASSPDEDISSKNAK